MKIKSIKSIPRWDSFKGLSVPDWERLNSGKSIEIDEIPPLLEDYVEEVKRSKK